MESHKRVGMDRAAASALWSAVSSAFPARVQALLDGGANPNGWAVLGRECWLEWARGPVFNQLVEAGCKAEGMVEARLRFWTGDHGARVGHASSGQFRAGPQAASRAAAAEVGLLLSHGMAFEGDGSRALLAAVGLGPLVRGVLVDAGARMGAQATRSAKRLAWQGYVGNAPKLWVQERDELVALCEAARLEWVCGSKQEAPPAPAKRL